MSLNTELQREIRMSQLFSIAIGSMIGVGWITVMGQLLSTAGPFGVALAFAGGGLIIMIIAICYCELATCIPATGGEVAYSYIIYGKFASAIVGWMLALGYVSVVAFEIISVAWLFEGLFPMLAGDVLYTVLDYDVRVGGFTAGMITLVIITAINYRGAKLSARFQDVATASLLVFVGILIILGFLFGDAQNLDPLITTKEESSSIAWAAVLSILATTPFWYSGFDTVPQAMGERAHGTNLGKLPKAVALAVLGAILFYVLVGISTAMTAPRDALVDAVVPTAFGFETALGSPIAGKLVLFVGLLGLTTSWNVLHFAGARVVFALARARFLHVSLADVHSKYHSPANAVLFVGVCGTLLGFLGRNAILPIVNAGAIALAIVFGSMCLGVAVLRRKRKDLKRPFKVPWGVTLPILAAVLSLGLVVYALYDSWISSDLAIPVEWSVLLVWVVFGLFIWLLSKKSRDQLSEEELERRILVENEMAD